MLEESQLSTDRPTSHAANSLRTLIVKAYASQRRWHQDMSANIDDVYEMQRVARAPKFIRFGRGGGAKFIRFGRSGTNTWITMIEQKY
ncbi:unnamed protein product [Heligmosomoides polygyrus]|uniref:Uncharacterized protein n=1 Tax=Heligmosomoides polygyrus TaxID=6339 RepID=A0A183GCS7_HELPZ|nr:unnamed protein product [Heligmosomoides polygyrus]